MALDLLKRLTVTLSEVTHGGAAVLIGFAVLQAFSLALRSAWRGRRERLEKGDFEVTEAIRLRLGRWLALALEFELAADILKTAAAPSDGGSSFVERDRSAIGHRGPSYGAQLFPPARGGKGGVSGKEQEFVNGSVTLKDEPGSK